MKKLGLVIVLGIFVLGIFGINAARYNRQLRRAAYETANETLQQMRVSAESIKVVADFCSKLSEKHKTSVGEFWVTCSVSADFFDPTTYKTSVKGNDIILPVSIFARIRNATDVDRFFNRGYRTKMYSVSTFAWDRDPKNGRGQILAEGHTQFQNVDR